MLFPFESRSLSIPSLKRELVKTLLSDLNGSGADGHLMLFDEAFAIVMTFEAGEPVSACRCQCPEGLTRLPPGLNSPLDHLPQTMAVEFLKADPGAVAMVKNFCLSEPAWRSPLSNGIDAAYAESARWKAALLARISDSVCELAVMEKDRFKIGYVFNPDEHCFSKAGRKKFEASERSEGFLEVVPIGRQIYPEPGISPGLDPLEETGKRYAEILDICVGIMKFQLGSDGVKILAGILGRFKKKYPPL